MKEPMRALVYILGVFGVVFLFYTVARVNSPGGLIPSAPWFCGLGAGWITSKIGSWYYGE